LNTTGFFTNVPAPLTNDFVVLRLDQRLTSKWQVSGMGLFSRALTDRNLQIDIRSGSGRSTSRSVNFGDAATGNITGQITPNLLSVTHIGWVFNHSVQNAVRPSDSAALLNLPGTSTSAGFVALVPPGILGAPIDVATGAARNQGQLSGSLQVGADLSWTKGSHLVQWGGNLRQLPDFTFRDDKIAGSINSLTAPITAGGSSTFNSLPSSVIPPLCAGTITVNCLRAGDVNQWNQLFGATLGLVDSVSTLLTRDGSLKPQPLGSPIFASPTNRAYDFYLQDTWRVSNTFNVIYGLTYQWQTPPEEANGKQTLIVDASDNRILTADGYLTAKRQAALQGQIYNPTLGFMPIRSSGRDTLWDTDRSNVGPRVAVSWNPSYKTGVLGRLFGDKRRSCVAALESPTTGSTIL